MAFDLTSRARELRPSAAPALARGLTPFALCVAFAVLMQLAVKPAVDAYTARLLLDIGTNIVLAVSLTMVNGFTGQFSMGHAGFLAVGGYVAATVMYYGSLRLWGNAEMAGGMLSSMPIKPQPGRSPFSPGDVLFLCSLVAGGLVSGVFGILVGLPSLRLRGDYLAIVTLGFGEIVRVTIQQTGPVIKDAATARATPWPELFTRVGGSLGFSGPPPYTSLFWAFLAATLTVLVAIRLKRSTFGRAFLSIREDEIASEAMGVNTVRYKVEAFVISAFFAGIAGGLYAHTLGVGLSPQAAGFQKSFDIIIMVVLGGLGSVSGAVIAAVVLTLLPEYLRELSNYRMIVFSLALILMMIFRPQGLLGVRELWDAALWRPIARRFGKGGAG
ncbi:MAG TPA: branched-chain amino acid ABC transporter permease [Phycisphaerales bacterium]|nr:branched-chain amino acid ABC transporter permease [Phycisphaerales bacterium]